MLGRKTSVKKMTGDRRLDKNDIYTNLRKAAERRNVWQTSRRDYPKPVESAH